MKTTALLLCITSLSHAQSTISVTDRYAYAANAGWIDFRPSAPDGVRVLDTCLAGFAYAANFGWISLGDGTPANGHTYANTSATDFGVNISPSGLLTGNAYAANIGWITFKQTHGQPLLNPLNGKFSGHAYAANLGWIALATTSSDLVTTTIARPDTDADGIPDACENLRFGNLTAANATSDSDGDGQSYAAEYTADTLPQDATSSLRITAHTYPSPSQVNLTFTTRPTRLYRIEHDTDLLSPWTNSTLGTFSPSAGPTTDAALTGLTPSPAASTAPSPSCHCPKLSRPSHSLLH